MFKSFSTRFFVLYTIATFALFLLLFWVFIQSVSNYFIESKQNSMIKEAQAINQQYMATHYNKESTFLSFKYQINTISFHVQSRIFVLTRDRRIYVDSDKSNTSMEGYYLDNSIVDAAFAKTSTVETGHFENLFVEPVLTVAVPMVVGEHVMGVTILNSPYPNLRQDQNYIYTLTFFSFLLILGIAMFSTFLFSRKVRTTFAAFNGNARAIAGGNFSSRINVPMDNGGEIWELAQNMNYMAGELEKLEDMRKDFIANISHDFRSPLTSIRGFAQAIMDGTVPVEKQDKYLSIILDETDRLTKLTNEILLLTKMENQVDRPVPTAFDIHGVIRKVIMKYERNIINKEIDITLLIDQKELLVFADLNQIQRAITNLVDNALKFCSDHDKLVLETTVVKDKVEISIKDTGPGIQPEELKYIWQRFHKADRSRGKDKKGVGLGLSIVREIIKAHNETIKVESQVGIGTTFTFTLPLATGDLGKRTTPLN
ncbi:sensor histidine kinase [Anaerotalea alkaliphila]|uniref:histidine kinase n=1 Tax=Anaerotalea alkaliphila TaxID=2662126 RepID=A0A7X5HUG2_9FIRM|nr:HAMP domain-containing sensor histidine kinase [Anaerotalea alkaliphila]NDL66760.1 HAMP domain-containing histidine kinase [Anaerotalea alkaliphila]